MLKKRHGSILKRHGSDKRRRGSSSSSSLSVELEVLPHDVIELILERLPVESLRRFRSVSKKWISTIDSPRFQSRQLNLRRQSRGHDLLFVAYYEDPPDDVAQHALGSSSSCIYRTVKFPFPNVLLCYGSCDGLVCFFCIHTPNVVVNPATRWHRNTMLKRRHGSILKRHGSDKRRRGSSSSVELEVLPHDVIELILERLPVESLRRFRSVSKKWIFTIDSPSFQSRQLNLRRQSRGHDLLFVAYYEDPPDDVAQHALGSSSSCIYRTVKFPFPNLLLCYGSCDGLVCLFCIDTPNVVVNPATRWHQIFDFSTHSWRNLVASSPYPILRFQKPVYFDGSLYWLTDCVETKVLSFDLHTETFQVICKAPFADDAPLPSNVVLFILDHCLCASEKTWPTQVIWSLDSSSKTWKQMCSIDLTNTFPLFDRCGLMPLPVAILEKNKLYLHGRNYLEPLMLHDLNTKSFEVVSTPTTPGDCIYYFESLCSV
ncbi:hypothetical protein HID58_036680 [Brassica napus]|uniref:F-box domain-containing protein n=1 Tax=Brassica napus TaxID=3708 RepID=A0ABQ8C8H0_BRANA|nr:hypothetical protein HID58_036680 [Brassica napus]